MRTSVTAFGCVVVLAACEHSAAFTTPMYLTGPFNSAVPLQLTFSRGCDLLGSLSPSGRLLTYSFGVDEQSSDYPAHCPAGDTCVAVLPVAGGIRQDIACHPLHPEPGVVHASFAAAVADDGSLLWAETARLAGSQVARNGAIMLRRPGEAPRRVLPMLTLFPEADFVLRHTSGIWWLGSDEAIIVDSAGALVIGINATDRGEVRRVAGVVGLVRPGVDAVTRRIAWVDATNSEVRVTSIDGGPSELFAPIPQPERWFARGITGFGFHGQTALVGQRGLVTSPDGEVSFKSQLVLLQPGRSPIIVAESAGEVLWGASAIALDERSAVVERIDLIPSAPGRIDINLVVLPLPVPGP